MRKTEFENREQDLLGSGGDRKDVKLERSEREVVLGISQRSPLEA